MIVPTCQSGKYLRACVRYNGKSHSLPLHRLVWALSNGAIPDGYYIDHIDNNPANNHPYNLRLATPMQNAWNTYRGVNKNLKHAGNSWWGEMMKDGVRYKT
ncbi:TPA: HNH endonuclease, partial [Enterobacter hormaechei]|nr:HNH endonuclease [Enterobacter hormaechei]HBL9125594.1 HNH endonuclease [Enterobacter hormaechei]HCC6647863.1 HNH endonuclease [Enterobacter hormaechei]